ncbi:MAG TPA: NAD(P)/FAD-dependent oxidoreductase [Acidimicrobiales bacterium]|nr:NAD(P)/FAD-dependent oxidoreductase [Acidimicrobiales bacterium]
MARQVAAEVAVVGMGPGGEALANRLADAGMDVVGIDERLLGGECPYWGCIPSKMMIRAANLLAEARRIPGVAGDSSVQPSWEPVAKRVREATDDWHDRVAVERFESKGGRFLRGHARLEGPNRVVIDDGTEVAVSAGVVINCGTSPAIPPVEGLGEAGYWTNRAAMETDKVPGELVVLGGGAIGLELAQMFRRFGAQVTVVESDGRLLAMEEPESSMLIGEVFDREGIVVRLAVRAKRAERRDGKVILHLDDGSEAIGDRLLVATGRRVNLKMLNLSCIGLDEEARSLPTDERMRVAPGVWAIGDVTGKGAFTHMSMYQAGIAGDDILSTTGRTDPENRGRTADYRAVPRVTFTDPEIGSVGLSAEAAKKEGRRVRVGTSSVPESSRGWIHGPGNDGFIKLVQDADSGLLVGATSAGPVGGEVLSMLVLAVHAEIPVDSLRSMIYAFPTFHRALEPALAELANAGDA